MEFWRNVSSSIQPIELEEAEASIKASQKLITELSEGISKLMLPFYEQFKDYRTENGKIMGQYTVLNFPTPDQVRLHNRKMNSFSGYETTVSESSLHPKVNFREIANRVQEKERQESRHLSESKIHQLLDQNEADQFNDHQYGEPYNSEYSQKKKLEKARKYYEKLAKDMKSGKRYRKRMKDKNRPKKAKSAYNLFVEDVVPQIKAENPSFSAPDLVRVAAKMYNQLTEEEKQPYQKRYMIDKERFEREREAYFRQNPERDYRLDAKQKAYAQIGKFRQM